AARPASGAAPAKPAAPGAKPAAGTPPAKPGATAGGTPAKPGAAPAKPGAKPPAKKPGKTGATGRRKIDQVLVDLGFIDEDQLWDLTDESKSSGQTIGEVAVTRGLITDEQLLQALGELYGLKVAKVEDL